MTASRQRVAGALLIVVLAAVMRLGAILYWPPPNLPETVDQGEYVALAQNVRLHGTYSYGMPHSWGTKAKLDAPGPFEPAAARAPLYSFLIAGLWWQETPPLQSVRLAQVMLGSIVAVLVYVIALEAFGLTTAVIAGLAMAMAPLTIFTTTLLVSETLFSFLLTTSVWFWMRRQGVLAGGMLGLAMLTRAAALPLSGAVLLLGLVLKADRRLNLAIVLVALAVVAPWTLRNAVTQGAFIPVASYGWGANLLLGTVDVPYGSGNEFLVYEKDPDFARIVGARTTIPEAERQMASIALARIRAAPLDWLWGRIKQYPRYWVGTGSFVSLNPLVKYGFVAGGMIYWLLAAAGVFLARRRWRELHPLALFPIVLSITHFVGASEERYSLGIVPMATIFAAHAFCVLVLRRRATPEAAQQP